MKDGGEDGVPEWVVLALDGNGDGSVCLIDSTGGWREKDLAGGSERGSRGFGEERFQKSSARVKGSVEFGGDGRCCECRGSGRIGGMEGGCGV